MSALDPRRPVDVGDRICTGDRPEDRLQVRSMLPALGRVDVMDGYGRMFTLDAGIVWAFREAARW